MPSHGGARLAFDDRLHPRLVRRLAEKRGLETRGRRTTGLRGAAEREYLLTRRDETVVARVQFTESGIYKSAQVLAREFRVPMRSPRATVGVRVKGGTPRAALDRFLAYLETEDLA